MSLEIIRQNIGRNGIYQYNGHQISKHKMFNRTETEIISYTVYCAENVSSKNAIPQALTRSDLHVAYLIGKYGCCTAPEVSRAISLRKVDVPNAIIGSDVMSVLQRLVSYGICGEYVLESPQQNEKSRRLFYVTPNGRDLINNSYDKLLKDLKFAYQRPSNELMGASASTFASLNLVECGLRVNDNKIQKIKSGVERFENILYNKKCSIIVESLYFNHDSTVMSVEEFEDVIRRKLIKVADYIMSDDNKYALLMCNNYNDMNMFFAALCDSQFNMYFDIVNKIYFTSVACLQAVKDVNDAVIHAKHIASDGAGYKPGDFVVGFDDGILN